MYKLRNLFDLLNEKFSQFGIFQINLSIDEQMVRYFGRHSAKMFMKGKPVRFGFKIWCLCSSYGYLFKCIPYCGKSAHYNPDIGLGGSVVMQLLEIVSCPSVHTIHFDNFFTSHALLVSLKSCGFFATGTVRENRLNGGCLVDSKELKYHGRGAYDCMSDKENNILAVKWFDNSAVCIATNFESIEPVQSTRRFSRKERKHVTITQPYLIKSYNQNMGGVDLHDNFIAKYRVRVKGKKWWWPLFVNMLDSALVNARRIHRLLLGTDDLLSFRRKVAIKLLNTQAPTLMRDQEPQQIHTGCPSLLSEIARPSVSHHYHSIVRNSKRLRCRHCKSQTIFKCSQCNYGLHPKCFDHLH
jgi:DNA excision repair protein ERCC-6